MVEVDSFYRYLISNGYYFDKELIENFLLSLKVKPFVILTGNSGTGKTKLSQLFAKFINGADYHKTKVTTRGRSWGFKKSKGTAGHDCGWTLLYECAKEFLPLDDLQGTCEIEVGGYTSQANIKLKPQLYYDKNNEKLIEYFRELYYKEEKIIEKDKKDNITHKKQLVDFYIDCHGILSVLSKNSFKEDEIEITMGNIDSFLSNTVQLAVEIFDYVPINNKTNCMVFANNCFSPAYFDFKYFISKYMTKDIENYLNTIKKDGETSFQIKISNFNPDISKFKPNWDLVRISDSTMGDTNNYVVVPIGANWTDNTNIVGYHNVITGKYQSTPSYDLIKSAQQDSKNPYFLILDEMNLSHVERYFADYLSAIESGEKIPLYGKKDSLKLPKNLFTVGTVNVDETTYMFSPKVLDRANTIEFNTFLAKDYMAFDFNQIDFNGNDVKYLQNPLDSEVFDLSMDSLKEMLLNIKVIGGNLWEVLADELTEFQKALKYSSFDFGFRVINEILRFMIVAWRYENSPSEWSNWERYFDAQIKQKILPKLHGSEKAIGNVLVNLFNLCLNERNNNENPKNFNINKEDCRYYTSALKLQNMSKVLSDQRYVSFIN